MMKTFFKVTFNIQRLEIHKKVKEIIFGASCRDQFLILLISCFFKQQEKKYIINIKKLPQKYLLKSFKINKKKPEKREKYV